MKQEKLTDHFLGFLLGPFLLLCGSSGYGALTAFKFWLLAAGCGVYAAALLLSRPTWRKPDAFEWLLGAYLLWNGLSALVNRVSPVGTSRREGVLTLALYIFIAFAVHRFGRPKVWMLHLLGVSVTVWSAIGALQLAGLNPFGLYPGDLTWQDAGVAYAGAYIGTTGNADLAAPLLGLALPLLLWGVLKQKLYWLALPLVSGLAVGLLCQVRAIPLALATLLPLLPGLLGKRKWLLPGAAAILAALLLIFCVDFGGTLGEAHDLLHGQADRYAGSGRVYIWTECVRLVGERPVFGLGPDGLVHAGLYFERLDAEANKLYRTVIDTPHNEFLAAAVHGGIPAGLLFLALFALGLGRKTSRPALLCWAVQACFTFSMVMTAPLFWIVLGLGAQKEDL